MESIRNSGQVKKELRETLKEHVRILIKGAGEILRKAQTQYKKNYDTHVRPTAEQLEAGDFVFVRRETPIKGERNKLASLVTVPYKVLRVAPRRVLIQTKTGYENDVSFDRVVKSPRIPSPHDMRTEIQLSRKDTEGVLL